MFQNKQGSFWLVATILATSSLDLLAVQPTSTEVIATDYSYTTDKNAAQNAAKWNITKEEWLKYQELKAGKRGIWSPGLDPLSTLGIHAKSSVERRKYAEKFVEVEYRRTIEEIAFQKEVDAAWLRLFPAKPRVTISPEKLLTTHFKRYAVVVSQNCSQCKRVVDQYISHIKNSKNTKKLDIYLADSGDNDKALRAWAKKMSINGSLVKRGLVTLNHGGSYSNQSGSVPVVYGMEGNGKWLKIR